jgi:hypothetical protein
MRKSKEQRAFALLQGQVSLLARRKGAPLSADALASRNAGNYRPAFNALTMPLPKPLA